jgi:hypothetical protein
MDVGTSDEPRACGTAEVKMAICEIYWNEVYDCVCAPGPCDTKMYYYATGDEPNPDFVEASHRAWARFLETGESYPPVSTPEELEAKRIYEAMIERDFRPRHPELFGSAVVPAYGEATEVDEEYQDR